MTKVLQVGVKAFIKKDNKYLLLLNNPEKYPEFQKWSIPGGRIESGHSLKENLKREIKEETNLELVEVKKLVAAQDIIKNDKHIVRLIYLVECDGEVRLSDEHINFNYFSKQEIRKLNNVDKYLTDILNRI